MYHGSSGSWSRIPWVPRTHFGNHCSRPLKFRRLKDHKITLGILHCHRLTVATNVTAHTPPTFFCFRNAHSDRCYDCTANSECVWKRFSAAWSYRGEFNSDRCYDCTAETVNVFERGTALPGRTEVSLTATTPCQICPCQSPKEIQKMSGK
jgi:hypothetical protein